MPVSSSAFHKRFVFRLQRIIAHGVDWADQRDAAALRGDAMDLLHGELRDSASAAARRRTAGPDRPWCSRTATSIIRLADAFRTDRVQQPRIVSMSVGMIIT